MNFRPGGRSYYRVSASLARRNARVASEGLIAPRRRKISDTTHQADNFQPLFAHIVRVVASKNTKITKAKVRTHSSTLALAYRQQGPEQP